jgi:hypothetical protein
MPRLLYTLLYYCLTPLLFFRLLIKHQKSNAYKEERQPLRLAERLGLFNLPDGFFKKTKIALNFHRSLSGFTLFL